MMPLYGYSWRTLIEATGHHVRISSGAKKVDAVLDEKYVAAR